MLDFVPIMKRRRVGSQDREATGGSRTFSGDPDEGQRELSLERKRRRVSMVMVNEDNDCY